MTDYLQEIIIGVIVFAALVSVIRRLLPAWSRARQQALAQWLDRPGRGGSLRAVGRFLRPGESAGGCGSGCNTCSSCDTAGSDAPGKNDDSKPLEFRRHP